MARRHWWLSPCCNAACRNWPQRLLPSPWVSLPWQPCAPCTRPAEPWPWPPCWPPRQTICPGLTYVFSSVVLGTSCLVLAGIGWNHATGRKYPFRQPAEAPHPHGTSDATPERRLAPSPEVLASALDRLRLSANLGVEDLARLIDIAEAESAAQNAGPMTAERMMSHDLITVSPHTLLPDLAREFRIHRFKSLPIRHPDGSYGGLVPQSALIGRSDADVTAEMLADPNLSTARRGTNLGEMMQLLADGHQQSVPVVENGQLVGLVTRSDLIAILASHLRQS